MKLPVMITRSDLLIQTKEVLLYYFLSDHELDLRFTASFDQTAAQDDILSPSLPVVERRRCGALKQ